MDKDNKKMNEAPFWISTRFGMAVLLSFGLYCAFSLRLNANMAIVCMVNYTALKTDDQNDTNVSDCGLTSANSTELNYKDGPFVWDRLMQGHILSIFYLPYGIAQTPTSMLITRYGARRVFGLATIIAASVTILIPLAATYSFILVVVIRGLMGILTAGVYICCQYVFGRWAPPDERTRLSSICFAGIEFGTIRTYFFSGLMCDHIEINGWSYIFYVTGGSTLMWCSVWFIFAADTPEQSKWISNQEKEYLTQTINTTKENEEKQIKLNQSIPWRSIFTSLPVYAIMVANFCSDWAHILMWTYVPTYLNDVFDFDFKYNGFISAISSLPHAAVILISGRLSDFVLDSIIIFNHYIPAMVIPAVMLISLSYVDCSQPTLAIVILIAGMAIRGFRFSGYIVNAMDITPSLVELYLLSREEWMTVFFITSTIEIFGSLFYLMFASADVQSWNNTSNVVLDVELLEYKKNVENNKIPVKNSTNS
ncbi:hypothetical protein KUTeg_012231 [Tegillarca granosa]|uniref:Major facilitator superfamily (MFS) profile domain-containing protein n=1 Tax=Tegillarca granosa TaxID=220873 RepID=A0ABQ9F1C1_TEGGR|nr:hypothetical protein KUTeg_012231 [Tegillarca granosa]